MNVNHQQCDHDKNGKMNRIPSVKKITRKTFSLVKAHKDEISTGGMASKLKAVEALNGTGCPAVIANGRKTGILLRIMNGDDVGTFFPARD